ncbi:MAG TPA: helix-turn-helix transcriptional regulator, partial [Reyranellaceae bacterium]|nr:helix-turn-helix transcriptional regulator [Reyranellaceae bacterium]
MNQAQLGEVLGVSQQQAARYEHGENSLNLAQIRRLAEFFDVPPEAVIERDMLPIPVLYRVAQYGSDVEPLELPRADGFARPRRRLAHPEQL